MSKINRFDGNYKAFASEQLTNERTTFGTEVISDDLTAQQTPEYLRGMGIVGPSQFPTLQDFNAVNYSATQSIAYLHQMGVPEWNGEQEYQVGSATNRNGALYFCQTADHASATPPESDAVNWIKDSKDKVIHVNNIAALQGLDLTDIEAVFVGMYHNITDTSGGGLFVKATGSHDGGTFIDPNRPFPTNWDDQAQLAAWFATTGGTVDGLKRQYTDKVTPGIFGAFSDGLTDDFKSIEAAINTGASVHFSAGTYKSGQTLVPQQDTIWSGDGMNQTTIVGNGVDPVIERAETVHASFKFNFKLENMTVNAASSSGKAVNFELLNFITIDHVKIENADGAFTGIGLALKEVYFWEVHKCYIENVSGACIALQKGPWTGANNGSILQCELVGNNNPNCIAITGDNTQNLLVEGCDLEGSSNGYQAISLKDCDGWSIRDNYIELWLSNAISLTDGGNLRTSISNNVINGGTPIIALNTTGAPNRNTIIEHNRFPDAGVAAVCVSIGNSVNTSVKANDPDISKMTERYNSSPNSYGRIVYSASWDPGVIVPGASTRTVIPAPDAEVGDSVEASFSNIPDGVSITISSYVPSAGNIAVVVVNVGETGLDLGVGNVSAKLLKDK